MKLIVVLCGLFFALRAAAHPSGSSAVAWPNDPSVTGQVVDREFRFTWVDSNFPVTTATITIDWYYTARMPATFRLGTEPPDLEGTPIVLGIGEHDLTDAYVWDTSTVAPGSYWIWSRVNDLPDEMGSLQIIAFSRAPVTIAHPGDVVHPSIAVVTPNNPYVIAIENMRIDLDVFDPDGSGRITLEAMTRRDGSDAITIAADVPASQKTFTWDTRSVAQGQWFFRATLRDARGVSFVAYSRFPFEVVQLNTSGDGGLDAGVTDGRADASVRDATRALDAIGSVEPEPEGCSCATSRHRSAGSVAGLLLLGFMLLLRRRWSSLVLVAAWSVAAPSKAEAGACTA